MPPCISMFLNALTKINKLFYATLYYYLHLTVDLWIVETEASLLFNRLLHRHLLAFSENFDKIYS